jgi:hypothetical protein
MTAPRRVTCFAASGAHRRAPHMGASSACAHACAAVAHSVATPALVSSITFVSSSSTLVFPTSAPDTAGVGNPSVAEVVEKITA